MGILFEAKGNIANFKLENDEIKSFEFNYSVPDSRYAKGFKDHRALIIKGSIPRTLARSKEALEQIRKWSKDEYKDPSYYSYAKVTHIYRDEVIREITFPDAFIQKYQEEIDPFTGDGVYIITLLQKLDKRIDIKIEPFNVKFPTLSEMWAKRREERDARKKLKQREKPLVVLSAVAVGGNEDEEQEWNSPYWIPRNQVVHDRIEVVGIRGSATGTLLHAEGPNSSRTITVSETEFSIEGARRVDGVVWYNVYNNVWIRGGDNIREIGSTTERGARMIVLPTRADGIALVRGYWDPDRPPGEEGMFRVLNEINHGFINAGERHGFDGLAGTRMSGNVERGLIEGSVVILAGRKRNRNGIALVEIIRWGEAGMRMPEISAQGRVINIPNAINGTITINGNSENVSLDPRRFWFSHYHTRAFERDSNGRIKVAVGPKSKRPELS